MKRASKWYHIDAVLGKPNASHKAKLLVLSASELGRWVAKHLSEGYTITLTEVEKSYANQGTNQKAITFAPRA